jgi:pimeloyl-ACP methyl ester carboxylesterase
MSAASSTAPPVFKSAAGRARYLQAYDAVVREWPVACEQLDLPTRMGTTHVIASGPAAAPPVFLLPSLGGSATLWRPSAAALSAEHRVYCVDVIGQTGKSAASRRIRDRADCASWLADLFDALAVQSASLVGSSYGAFLAMNQAVATPERVRRLVLIGPAGTFVGGLLWILLRARLKRLLRGEKKPREITDLLGPGERLAPSDAAWGALMQIALRESARPNLIHPVVFGARELRAVRAPALLLVGERELLYSPHKVLERARRHMPGIQTAIIPGAHHLAALARPDEVNARILAFLKAPSPP